MINIDEIDTKRLSKLYFKTAYGQLAKTIAAHIRDQNRMCNLIDQKFFTGPETVEACALVLIQKSASNAKLIATCYEKFGSDGVEIVFFDDEGNVADDDEPEKPAISTKPVEAPVADTTGPDGTDEADTDGPAGLPEGHPEGDTGDGINP
jgi:hypothetical protein